MNSYYGSTYSSSSDLVEGAAWTSILGTYSIAIIALYVLLIVAQWKIFTKAGEKGWKCLIPIYNLVVLYKIIGLSPWLILLFLLSWIPVVGYIMVFVLSIVQTVKLGKAFGKSTGFILGLIFLSPIFQLILAFGSSQYVGTNTNTTSSNPPTDNTNQTNM